MFDNSGLPSFNGVKVAVLGGGVSGASLARLAARTGARVFLSDAKKISDETVSLLNSVGATYESGGHTDKILGCDMVVTSSGFPPNVEIIKRARDAGIPIVGELDFAAPCLRGRIIGITGSNGKTTTTSLLGHLLKFLNPLSKGIAVVGNIGDPIAETAGVEYDYIIAELSSFQLHWAKDIVLDAAVVTNLAPDHIDWHGSYENYVADKAKILSFVKGQKRENTHKTTHVNETLLSSGMSRPFSYLAGSEDGQSGFSIVRGEEYSALKPGGDNVLALEWDVPLSGDKIVLSSSDRCAFAFGDVLFYFDDTSLLGRHNMENVAMAMAAVGRLGFNVSSARKALATYVPPPHRCSLVLSAEGVKYIDDSKGTNVAATVTALASIEGRKIIILGGRGKGEDYGALVEPLKKYAKCAILIGEASGDIAGVLHAGGYENYTELGGMESAVRRACSAAEAGDVVLLSPACTSWDTYRNYGERGDHFASLVREITGSGI